MINPFGGQYRWLSNFWFCTINYDSRVWTSVEHAYQGTKCRYFGASETIHKAGTPGEAKRLGKIFQKREDWEEVNEKVMLNLVREKFKDKELRRKLLATGKQELVEGNYWGDTFWGVDSKKGGTNKLGKILMKVRKELRDESNSY